MLEFCPILVDENMQVLDGQHRIEAAKALGCEVYYQVQKESHAENIILLNAASKIWSTEDYLNFHIKSGNENYRKLQEFCNKNNVLVGHFLRLKGSQANGSKNSSSFRSGSYRFPSEEQIAELEDKYKKIALVNKEISTYCFSRKIDTRSSYYVNALFELFDCNNFNFDLFLRKIPMRADLVRKCASTFAYLQMFKDIYNYQNRNPIE